MTEVVKTEVVKTEAKPSTPCVWPADDMTRLRRLMCLGVPKGTFTCEDTPIPTDWDCIQNLIDKNQGVDVVAEIKDFSINGRVAKHPPLLMALAFCARSKDSATKQAAYAAVPEICRIPTDLFLFVKYIEDLGKSELTGTSGWGRALRKAITSWYVTKDPKTLAMFVTKYKQRNGWAHKDLLRLSHVNPKNVEPGIALVLKYATKGYKKTKEDYADDGMTDEQKALLKYLDIVETVKHSKEDEIPKVVAFIEEHNLVREHVPTWLLKSKEIWRALLQNMPMEALLRSLSKLSLLELLDAEDDCVKVVLEKLKDTERLKESRLHPMNVLLALEGYKKGFSEKNKKQKWTPNAEIRDALEHHTFYDTFKNVEPTNKNYLLCVDVSASMQYGNVHGCSQLTPERAAASMVMVTARTEPNYSTMAFSSEGLKPIKITPEQTIQEVTHTFSKVKMGGTDCAAPMRWAEENKKTFDVFIVYTDCDSWQVETHAADALRNYRTALNVPNARLVVCALTNPKQTIADPEDAGMLDIAGFDTAVPQIIRNFVMGKL